MQEDQWGWSKAVPRTKTTARVTSRTKVWTVRTRTVPSTSSGDSWWTRCCSIHKNKTSLVFSDMTFNVFGLKKKAWRHEHRNELFCRTLFLTHPVQTLLRVRCMTIQTEKMRRAGPKWMTRVAGGWSKARSSLRPHLWASTTTTAALTIYARHVYAHVTQKKNPKFVHG